MPKNVRAWSKMADQITKSAKDHEKRDSDFVMPFFSAW